MSEEQVTTDPIAPLARVMERNIGALLERQRREEQESGFEERLADRITSFAGRMYFVYLHLAIVAFWIASNMGWIPGVPRFDRTFVILATVASVESIFLSAFILISQNRMQVRADRRSDLDLQVSLLAEHEVTRLVSLVKTIAEKMEIAEAQNPELKELVQDIAPERVLDVLEEKEHHQEKSSV